MESVPLSMVLKDLLLLPSFSAPPPPHPPAPPPARLFSNLQVIMIASQFLPVFLPILTHILFYLDENFDNVYTFNRAAF